MSFLIRFIFISLFIYVFIHQSMLGPGGGGGLDKPSSPLGRELDKRWAPRGRGIWHISYYCISYWQWVPRGGELDKPRWPLGGDFDIGKSGLCNTPPPFPRSTQTCSVYIYDVTLSPIPIGGFLNFATDTFHRVNLLASKVGYSRSFGKEQFLWNSR